MAAPPLQNKLAPPNQHIYVSVRYLHTKENTRTSRVFSLVRHIDLSWNTLEPSLILIQQKLVDLGWVYYGGEIHIVELEIEESHRHII